MRKINLLIIGVFAAFIIGAVSVKISPCDQPVYYKLGTIDKEFNISSDQFLTDTKDASSIWNKLQGKDLYQYDPKAVLTINLIFDSRQQLENQIGSLESKVKNQESSLDAQIAQYQQLVNEFNKRVADLNSQIAYWNGKGGAPPDVYQQLKNEQNDLENEATSLNQTAKSLNLKTQSYNSQVVSLNNTISSFNSEIIIKPEQGLYDVNNQKIDIYFSRNRNELIHTLAHELGHALGMNHLADTRAIMYKEATDSVVATKDDKDELQRVCMKRSLLQTFLEKLPRLSFSR